MSEMSANGETDENNYKTSSSNFIRNLSSSQILHDLTIKNTLFRINLHKSYIQIASNQCATSRNLLNTWVNIFFVF